MNDSAGIDTFVTGVVGLGVGWAHAETYERLPDCELRWLFDVDESRARRGRDTWPGVRAALTFDDIAADPEVNLVSIASHDDAHCNQVLELLEAGKNVFVEKPMCRSMAELETIHAAWRRSSLAGGLGSNLVLRAAPLYRRLKAWIREGVFGEIYAADGDYLYGRIEKITQGWRGRISDYSVLLGGGIHMTDLILWLTGQKPNRVKAVGNRISTEGSAFRSSDFVSAVYSFESGLVARVTANFGCVHRHQHVLRLFGTKATFEYDDRGARIHTSRDPSHLPDEVDDSPLPSHKGDLIPDFLRTVRSGDPAPVRHEFDLMCACLAADASLRTGSEVDVEYLS